MANEAYQKVVSMIDRTVNDAGILLQHLRDRPQRSSSASNYSKYGLRATARARPNDSCKTPPSYSPSTSGSPHTPPYPRKRKAKIKEKVYTFDSQYDNHGEVKIMHANNVYITCDSDGMVVGMPEPVIKTEESKANEQPKKVSSSTKTAVEGQTYGETQKVDRGTEMVEYNASSMKTKEQDKTFPKIITPRRKSSSKSTSKKKKKSYLKETVTRTEILTTKEVPDGVGGSPSKAVVKNKEIKTTTTTNIYPDKTPEAPLPQTQIKRTFTRSESLDSSKNVEPFSRFLLNGEKESSQKDYIATIKDALEVALRNWEEKHRPKQPIDPYRPPKKSSKKSFRTSSRRSSKVKVIRIDTSAANTKEAKMPRRKISKKKKREKTNVANSTTPPKNDELKTATKATSNGDSAALPEWGLSSAELPVEKRAKRGKLEPPSTLTFSPSHSSLLGKKVKPRSPLKVRRHSRSQKRSEGFKLAEKSESYLDRQISAARRRERTAKKQIRQARESIKESKKSMKYSDKEKRSVKTFENPTSPRFLKPKYDVPDELKIQREESSTSGSSKKIKKARTPRKKKSKREPADISEATFMKTAKIVTPTQPSTKPEWGLSSQELAVEYSPRKSTTAKPPPETLRYSSSHSSLIGGKVQRKSPPSARFRKHSKKSRRSDGLRLAERSESYLDRQINAARKREKTAKLQIQRSRTKIIEAKKAMKEKDEASRSKKTFENPASPKYLKAKYAIPEELKVRRDSDEKASDQSESEKRPKPPTSDSQSAKRLSKSSEKEDKREYVETDEEFEPEKPEQSESYMNLVNRYAIAGRKIKKSLEKTENIRAKRASIRQSRKTMSGHDEEKRSREFMNPAKAPSVHTIQKKQELIASELRRVERKQALSPKELKSRTALTPKIGRHFKRLEAPGGRRSHKRYMRKRPKKKEKFRPAAPSQSWLLHSLKFAEAGRKARRKPGDEDHLPEGFKKSGYSGEEIAGSKEKTGSERGGLDTALSMDLNGSERDSIRAKRDFPSLRESRPTASLTAAGKPRSESLKIIYNTARSKTPTKRRDERPVCWKCKKCNATLTPSMVSRGEAEMESPLALTSAGPTEESSIDPRLLTPRGSATSLRKSSKSKKEKSEFWVRKSILAEPIPPCTCEDKIAIRDGAANNDLNFDAKFELHDVDTDRQHTLVINGYFIDKNLKRLTLNGMFCKL